MTRLTRALIIIGAAAFPAQTMAADATARIDRAACARLVEHVPADDVAYRPGVDVRGNAVAPANVGGGRSIKVPEEISIDIGRDIASKYMPGVAGGYGKTSVGTVTVKNGKTYFNGEPIADRDQAALAAACKKAGIR
ncbi:MAG: hypothetical protein H7840_06550 [Alphaproteobacteria bacterium]